ncbi:NtaA/DmoA family FMN-dependent monooxygenase [Amycolatopsis sp. WQ 127309]|uniref:NtaA/DmoA family FMN-dependent monooxygenase n=1 Tax=Amycolatopsis sp. WQ 127309 TaxID=2932773 RepID=UPI001FF4A40B|nr:NtaA/DmoA family FMN-dependent monooxygenase [Amycolatopsis sp. WQ 127309]UOZ03328.1 NtaA/DmoA family FMN-dependent monooxygenase [Amycolatopsis sp. WQ 127309]
MTRFLALSALVHGSGGHTAGWRHPEAYAAGQLDFAFHAELARLLERGRFDAFFVADVVAVEGPPSRAVRFEPFSLLAALSTVTTHIGLVGTVGTTHHEPYHVARKFASLDHLSHGRAGWHAVTAAVAEEVANFGSLGRPAAGNEFVDVVRQLWDSFSDKALVRDVAGSRYYEPDQLRTPEHHGGHFRVRGPLNISRPPQGHPVLFVTSTDEPFAAKHGEVFFTEQPDVGAATAVRARVAAAGRDPGQVRVWPLLSPLVADTEAAARRKVAELDDLAQAPGGSIVAGTPEQIAHRMQQWFTEGAADGFTVSFPYFPGPAIDFVQQVVPILRRRGLVPDGYRGTTLRENLGLARPEVSR